MLARHFRQIGSVEHFTVELPPHLSRCNKGFVTCTPLSSGGSRPRGPSSQRGAIRPGSHSSGRHRAVHIAAASGRKQLRLKIGPDTGKKTPLPPELTT